jgi:hypothetical protein
MTNIESSIYNRTSTLAHAYLKHYYPDVLKKLAAKAEEDYKLRKSRRNSLAEIQEVLRPIVVDSL